MRKAVKSKGKLVEAYELGGDSERVNQLITEGKIKKVSADQYAIFSQEATEEQGQIAHAGDYIKIDSANMPYPNSREFFLANHRLLQGNQYEQKPKVVQIWQITQDEMVPEIEFLLEHKGLQLDREDKEKTYKAPLWGSVLTAAQDAYLVLYSVTRDETGTIVDVDFNFVENTEFHKTYVCLD